MTNVTLHLGDCLDAMATLEAGSIDAILCDLPYGTTACKWDEVIPFAPMWAAVKRVLRPRGVFVTTASQPFTSALVMSNLEWFRHEWIWQKAYGSNFMNTCREPLKEHECVLMFSRGKWTYNPQQEERSESGKGRANRQSLARLGGEDIYRPGLVPRPRPKRPELRLPSSVQKFDNERGLHPTQKPVALYAYLIRTYTNPGDTVLDFCMGSGTTGVAAMKEGRNFVGIELDSGYFAIAERRIEQAQMQLPLLLEPTP